MSNIEWGTETDKKLEQIAMKADYALEQRGGLDAAGRTPRTSWR